LSVVRTSFQSISSDREAITGAYDELDAAFDKVLGLSFDGLTAPEKLALQGPMERNLRRAPTVEHQLINSLVAEADPKALGGTSWADVLSTRLGISKEEAKKRIKRAGLLGPRQALTAESLAPTLSNVAVGQTRGQIGPEHVRIIEKFSTVCPAPHRLPDARGRRGRSGPHCHGSHAVPRRG
jgi:hypothetical protein